MSPAGGGGDRQGPAGADPPGGGLSNGSERQREPREGVAGTGNKTAEAGRDSPAGVGEAVCGQREPGRDAGGASWAVGWPVRGVGRAAPRGERGSGGDRTLTERTGLLAAGPPRPPGGVAGRDELGWGPLGSLLQGLQKEQNQKVQTCFSEKPGAQSQWALQRRIRKGPLYLSRMRSWDHMQSAGRPRP